jgi:hypothetical protein
VASTLSPAVQRCCDRPGLCPTRYGSWLIKCWNSKFAAQLPPGKQVQALEMCCIRRSITARYDLRIFRLALCVLSCATPLKLCARAPTPSIARTKAAYSEVSTEHVAASKAGNPTQRSAVPLPAATATHSTDEQPFQKVLLWRYGQRKMGLANANAG